MLKLTRAASMRLPGEASPLVALAARARVGPAGDLALRGGDVVAGFDVPGHVLGRLRVVVTVEPLVHLAGVGLVPAGDGLGQHFGAFGELVDVVDAEQAETDVLASVVL